MARKSLDSLAPGMKLSKPVLNLNGVLLLQSGEVLTPKHMSLFKTWGIREVDVVQQDGGGPEPEAGCIVPAEILAVIENEMKRRFRRVDLKRDPMMTEIHRIVGRQMIRRRLTQATAGSQQPRP
jgi:hypothetical protein